ncbi:hypothetical protein BDB00DRAFT_866145 [Zychaea mexicana]|uniref:uncharacterized protein n=1 Tax=Zychaea mexicana TaxID=64656 RepID=UPI0022FF1C65|nr:uncharacterized protein BDB00DRAFT_866145 [Zychaea mexicana]KAI9466380.1 hypothetical protein BDB00DRAFT_866145 [Zychaea mexicana]
MSRRSILLFVCLCVIMDFDVYPLQFIKIKGLICINRYLYCVCVCVCICGFVVQLGDCRSGLQKFGFT